MVSDQPSWGRRRASLSQRCGGNWFQTNPRGVGGSVGITTVTTTMSFRPTLVGSEVLVIIMLFISWSPFQTNPRGVGGLNAPSGKLSLTSFRPTLVGSEVKRHLIDCHTGSVSDQPSWGRRYLSWFDYTLTNQVSDQPSWGRRMSSETRDFDHYQEFQTNPRGVGGSSYYYHPMARLVSDQPSWGRRMIMSLLADTNSCFRPTLVGSEANVRYSTPKPVRRFRPTLVGSEEPHS